MSRLDRLVAGALAAIVIAGASAAQAREAGRPVAGRTPDMRDVALTPLTDLNLATDAIPAPLQAAVASPYAVGDLTSCAAIATAIAELDTVLGPDMDVAAYRSERLSPGVVAKNVVASFIPFRGILREVSGAADRQRTLQAAIYAGAVRRGFLKGLGQQQGCDYPARPAFVRVTMPRQRAIVPGTAAAPTAKPGSTSGKPHTIAR